MRLLSFPAFLCLSLPLISAFDVIIEALRKTIDRTTDPCDNFYRHACPLGSPSNIINTTVYQHTVEATDGVWDEIQIKNDFLYPTFNNSQEITDLYESLCNKGGNTTFFLQQVTDLYEFPLERLEKDPNCERVASFLRPLLDRIMTYEGQQSKTLKYYAMIDFHLSNVITISQHLDQKLEDAIEKVDEMVEDVKKIALEMIPNTPWTEKNNLTDLVLNNLKISHLVKEYAKIFRNSIDKVLKSEMYYRECKLKYDNDENSKLLCFLMTMKYRFFEKSNEDLPFYELDEDAFTIFPKMAFSFPFLYVLQNTKELAAQIGSIGIVVGHEVSHTIIRTGVNEVMPYFSNKSIECTQNQYSSTCNEFKEKSCEIGDDHINENGADILGIQLAHTLFERHYSGKLEDIYEPLNVTYHQLFFYSNVVHFCSGELGETRYTKGKLDGHAAHYIRVNAMVNHPAFQQAFHCSDNSRMMKSATNQCIMFGEGAPETRRK